MAHELTDTDNMLSVREMPWHGLGSVLPTEPTRAEAQAIAHPWEPVSAPVFAREMQVTPTGDLVEGFGEVEGFQAIQRSDNGATLSITNDTYGIVKNDEMWDIAEAVGNLGTDIHIETAGSLAGGKRVWVLLRFDEPIQITGDENGATLPLFALQNSHDGSSSFRGQALNTRIVCANTSAAADIEARKHGYEFRFRHSSKVTDRLEQAKEAVSMWRSGGAAWDREKRILADTRITASQQIEFIERFQPMPPEHLTTDRVRANVETARSQVREILTSETCASISDNAFGLFQAGIEWQQHFRATKGTGRERMESHFKRSMLSDGRVREDTLQLVREIALV